MLKKIFFFFCHERHCNFFFDVLYSAENCYIKMFKT